MNDINNFLDGLLGSDRPAQYGYLSAHDSVLAEGQLNLDYQRSRGTLWPSHQYTSDSLPPTATIRIRGETDQIQVCDLKICRPSNHIDFAIVNSNCDISSHNTGASK